MTQFSIQIIPPASSTRLLPAPVNLAVQYERELPGDNGNTTVANDHAPTNGIYGAVCLDSPAQDNIATARGHHSGEGRTVHRTCVSYKTSMRVSKVSLAGARRRN